MKQFMALMLAAATPVVAWAPPAPTAQAATAAIAEDFKPSPFNQPGQEAI